MGQTSRPLVTLLTDFGTEDGNVGVMKGVILGINPDARIVDVTHDISPQSIATAAYLLRRTYQYFPDHTVHVVVVDPGVGSERRPIAAGTSRTCFVAPDNGILSYVFDHLSGVGEDVHLVHLDHAAYWLPKVSNVFHGRDIFAPVAAHLSLGAALDALGTPIGDPVRLPPPILERHPRMVVGQVMHVDHFGNLLTNIPSSYLHSLGDAITTKVGPTEIGGLTQTFSRGRSGEPIAYIDSSDHLALAVVNGSARDVLSCQGGERVEVAAND
jgi:S-adenosylmethionine hydrolase